MAPFVKFEATPTISNDTFYNLSPLRYSFIRPIPVKKQEKEESPSFEVHELPATDKKTTQIKYRGIVHNLSNVLDTLKNSEPTALKHYCTRAVSNALDEISNVHHASGVADPKAMYSALKQEGWTDVLDDNYIPQAGDVWTYYENKNKMHTSMFDGKEWISYDKEGSEPWYFKSRGNKGHIQRYVAKGQQGMKFVQYSAPQQSIPDLEPIEFYQLPKWEPQYFVKKGTNSNSELIYVNPQYQEDYARYQDYDPNYSGPVTKSYMAHLYSKELARLGIDQKYVPMLVAHDSLESGHYTKQSGKYNFGGIKGNKTNGTLRDSHEFINGQKVKKASFFKDYKHPSEYVADKVRLLNDKYHAFDGRDFVQALVDGHYATDPEYGNKLRSMIK